MNASLCIVGGCGHIGLPLGIAFALAGAQVDLLDADENRVRKVAGGILPFWEEGAQSALAAALATGRLHATTAPEVLARAATVVVTIATSVDDFLEPGPGSFAGTMEQILAQMHDGQLLIVRSTLPPGTTQQVVVQAAGQGLDIDVAYCPERAAQGQVLDELHRLPQIVGGATAQAGNRAATLFEGLGVKVIHLLPLEAELAKLFTNAFRYIHFGIANQFDQVARHYSVEYRRICEAMTTDYPRLAALARPGLVGGPCLLKDTMHLDALGAVDFHFGEAAMEVNEGYVASLLDTVKARLSLAGRTAAILGMAFKGNCDDTRNSPAYCLLYLLQRECRRVLCTDPYIQDPSFVSLEKALAEADILFLGACHDAYREIRTARPIVDVFHFLKPAYTASPEARRAA
jgi:UDP-N-acetyl-D-mannosaminuronic acid dehydrogenase